MVQVWGYWLPGQVAGLALAAQLQKVRHLEPGSRDMQEELVSWDWEPGFGGAATMFWEACVDIAKVCEQATNHIFPGDLSVFIKTPTKQ